MFISYNFRPFSYWIKLNWVIRNRLHWLTGAQDIILGYIFDIFLIINKCRWKKIHIPGNIFYFGAKADNSYPKGLVHTDILAGKSYFSGMIILHVSACAEKSNPNGLVQSLLIS